MYLAVFRLILYQTTKFISHNVSKAFFCRVVKSLDCFVKCVKAIDFLSDDIFVRLFLYAHTAILSYGPDRLSVHPSGTYAPLCSC